MVQRDQFVDELARAIIEVLDQNDRRHALLESIHRGGRTPQLEALYENAHMARHAAAVRIARLAYDRDTHQSEEASNGRK